MSISAENADFVVEGGITVNGDDGAGGGAGNVSVRAKSINITEIQANGGGGSGSAGKGGDITLETTTGGIRVGSIFGQGGVESYHSWFWWFWWARRECGVSARGFT